MTPVELMWAERVRAWRQSGQTAAAFAEGKGFEASTLRFWSSRLRKKPAVPRIVQLVPKAAENEPVTEHSPRPELIIAIGGARIGVRPGFDKELLAEVVSALGAGR